jgi:hypothetical protein
MESFNSIDKFIKQPTFEKIYLDIALLNAVLLTEAAHQCQIDRNCIEEVLPVTAL